MFQSQQHEAVLGEVSCYPLSVYCPVKCIGQILLVKNCKDVWGQDSKASVYNVK